jgi:hypothetical protein
VRKYIDDMIMEMKFRIHKYSHVCNRVRTGYRGLTIFTHVDQYVSNSCEGCNFSFTYVEFRVVSSSAPTLCSISDRLSRWPSLGDLMEQ